MKKGQTWNDDFHEGVTRLIGIQIGLQIVSMRRNYQSSEEKKNFEHHIGLEYQGEEQQPDVKNVFLLGL